MRSHWSGIAPLGGIVPLGGVLLLSGVFLLGGSSAAWGQIAAPSIAPGTFSSENPAAVKWGAPSRFGLAAIGVRSTTTPVAAAPGTTGPGTTTTDFSGGLVGLRLVGESFAFGADLAHVDDQEPALKDTREAGSASIALQTGSALAWGLGYTGSKQTTDFAEWASREQTFGLSVRLGEVWFIGAAIGRETISSKDLDGFTVEYYGERTTYRYGLGFRRGGTVLVHAEAFAITKDDFDTDALGKFEGEDISGGTLEFGFGPFLIGGSGRRSTHRNSFIDTTDLTTADIGWAPRQGLTVTLHLESLVAKFKDPLPGSTESVKQETGAAVFTWLF